ncbi:MAG TPA: peptide ABC transporter substrate-binding protein [Ktedonobacterales bacterium]|jgi:peptide/nickel transport system substrate-binding protein/oligopeptide transport system substrate-binding protein
MQTLTRAGIHRGQLFFGLLALLAMLLVGCGPSNGSASQLDANQVFTWPLIHVANFNRLVLDPANVTDLYSATVTNAIYSGLVTTDRSLNVIPDLATAWEISPDGRTYTFHLRPDLHFSDGAPLTAQDFAYSINRALDPNICVPVSGPNCKGSPPAGIYLSNIKGASDRLSGAIPTLLDVGLLVPDAQTLVIKLDQPVAYFLEALTYPTAFPVEKKLVDQYGNNYPQHKDWTTHLDEGGSSGPFIIKSYEDTKLTLVPNPYWFGPKITLKEIVRPYVADPVDAYSGYRQGKYDYSEVPSQEYQAARDQEDFHEIGLLQTSYIGLNQGSPPFDDVDVRQAFALAINKQLIADRVLNGSAYPTNHIIPQGMPGFYTALTAPGINSRTVTGDPDTAKKLLNDYYARNPDDNGNLSVDLAYTNESTDTVRIAQALQAMWQTILPGITVNLKGMTFHDLVTAVLGTTVGNHDGALQMWMLGWSADYPDPQDWLSLQFSKGSPYNASNYQDGKGYTAWKLMSQADIEQDPTKRMSLYNQAEQQLVNDCAWIPYIQPKGIWRIKTYIQGFNPTALDLLSDLDWANVQVLAH